MTTIFRGIFAEALGGFLTVRGFAKLSDLAKYSIADIAYQRELKADHQADIEAFYRRAEYLFFPEVVLSLELLIDYDQPDAPSVDPWQAVRDGQGFRSNINGLDIKTTKTRTAADLTRLNVTVPETAGKVFKRIDGNHRLSAFEALGDPQYDRYVAPFCIVILPSSTARQNEKALFYNINSKALALTSEEVYRGIIDEQAFDDSTLQEDFGPEFTLCRQTRNDLNFTYLPHLRNVFGRNHGQEDNRCSVLIESLRDIQRERERLEKESPMPDAAGLLDAIQAINVIYADERLSRSTSLGLFSAFLFFSLEGGSINQQFVQWVLKNHLYELQTINASDLIRIFEKVAQSRKRQVFVSMQFQLDGKPNVNWEPIESAIKDLNRDHDLDIKLVPIRVDRFDKGFSYELNDEILKLIEDSGLLIADLTGGNKNVYHEVGYLMGLNQGKGLPHENFILLHNGSISDAKSDVGFNLSGIKQLRVEDTNRLREEVRKQVAVYYGLVVA
jgi:hypothetical protein